MGIKSLTSFIGENPNISKSFELHDTAVIFDGSNLIHALYYKYELDFRYGGEYERYYDCIRKFISSFLECNVKPIMIFNGGHEKNDITVKFTTERAEKILECTKSAARGQKCSYQVLPLLAHEVFYSVLFDLDIPLANCDYAADGQVAFLGNYYNCPVISTDSDFYVFDAHKGFINLKYIDSVINFGVGSDGKEYKFLSCKIYYIDEFVKAFPGLDENILPLFGTLIGSEFLKPETFDNFFSNIQLPEYKDRRLSFNSKYKRHIKMVGLLCWLQNKTLTEAVNEVISHFEKNEQEHIKSIIDISVYGYKQKPCSLTFIFDKKLNDPRNDLLSNSMIITPCGNQLPQHFALKFHQGYLPCFFINVIGLHRVILQPQVEDMELLSSHSCSSYIRRILYGILVRHDVNGSECRNEACLDVIEEYDRDESSIKKKDVLPLSLVEGIGLLPKLNEIQCIDKTKCIAIISKVLGIDSDFFLYVPDAWQLFIGSINYWLRASGCTSEAFISAVILNLIYFGFIKCKNHPFINQKCCPEKMSTGNKCACSSITCIASNVSKSDLQYAGNMLDKYYANPTLKPNRRLFLNIAHSFSQLQSCLLHIIFLNQLLNQYLESPNPHKCFSGTMLYNLTDEILSCPIPNIFIGKILGKDLNLLFTQLKSKVCENVPNFESFKKNRTC